MYIIISFCKLWSNKILSLSSLSLSVNNVILVQDNKAVHLGHFLNTDDKDSIVSAAIAPFWSSFHLFQSDFGHMQPNVQYKLFKQFCCSFYGVPLWLLSSDHVNDVSSVLNDGKP